MIYAVKTSVSEYHKNGKSLGLTVIRNYFTYQLFADGFRGAYGPILSDF